MLKCINLELEMRQTYLKNKAINTIYFGGGTPSILSKSEIKFILDSIYNIYKRYFGHRILFSGTLYLTKILSFFVFNAESYRNLGNIS